jgi:type IV pilus assembly protein PilY1
MRSMSEGVGGGEYYDLKGETFDPNDFELALADAFNRILSRNSVFASVALPAAANEQSTFLNQVFVGLFRPDGGGDPRWFGNLKQYQLGIDESDQTLKALDADAIELIDSTSGFIQGCARSFWTDDSGGSPYWEYLKGKAVDNCDEATRYYNNPDGPIVEKGGQAYVLRESTPSSRAVYTCDPTTATLTCSVLTSFYDGNNKITAELLDPSAPVSTAERTELIKWAIGYDIDNEHELTTPDPNTMRPSVHGDIVHSQPVAIDYNADSTDPANVVVFYGGNDGMLRAVNGNQEIDPAGGSELWSFLPPEFYGSIKRIRDNTPRVIFPASGPTAGEGVSGSPKPYGMDGPLTAYRADTTGDGVRDEKLIFAGLRRAGRAVYAFDVSTRAQPELKWKVGCPNLDNDTYCTSGWGELGQTWSRSSVTHADGYRDLSGEMEPLLLMGGGYDNCEDKDSGVGAIPEVNNTCSGGTKGDIVYLIEARTGNIVRTFPKPERAVAGKVTVVPVSDTDNRIMFAYLGDMGGNVYRISGPEVCDDVSRTNCHVEAIGATPPANWLMTKIADLGCPTTVGCDANRKFLFGPDVIRIPNSDQFGILIGSGDREKPLQDYSVTLDLQNYFFSIVDGPTVNNWLKSETGNCSGVEVICFNSLGEIDLPGQLPEDQIVGGTPTIKGWSLEMREGEQIVTGAITVDNDVKFSTHIPAVPGECGSDYGTATAFSVNYLDASGDATQFIGGGLVPTPVAGKILIDGVPVPFCIGCGGEGSAIGVQKVGGGITWTQPRSRVYWNIDRVE